MFLSHRLQVEQGKVVGQGFSVEGGVDRLSSDASILVSMLSIPFFFALDALDKWAGVFVPEKCFQAVQIFKYLQGGPIPYLSRRNYHSSLFCLSIFDRENKFDNIGTGSQFY